MPIQTQFPVTFLSTVSYPLVTANLTLDLDSRTGLFQTVGGVASSDGDPVGEWQDQSGNGRNVSATIATRPVINTNTLNGLPALDFDGDNDQLTGVTMDNVVANNSKTIFLVAKVNGIGTNRSDYTFDNDAIYADSGQYQGLHLKNTYPARAYCYNWDGTDDSAYVEIALNTWYIFEIYFESGVLYLSIDGINYSQVNTGNTLSLGSSLRIGGASGGYLVLQGKIVRVLFHNIALSSSQRQAQRHYLEYLYGLSPRAITSTYIDTFEEGFI